jgi:SPP1 family predicted phage head-tail adaptor
MMNAGRLDDRITIETRVLTANAYGEQVLTYTALATVWAEVMPTTGREVFMSAAMYADAQYKVRIRWRGDFDETARVNYDGMYYDIIHIADHRRSGERMLLMKKPS